MIAVNLPEETPATKANELLEGLAVSGKYVKPPGTNLPEVK